MRRRPPSAVSRSRATNGSRCNGISPATRFNSPYSMSIPQNQISKVLDRWRGEGTSNSMPRAVYSDPNMNVRHSDRFIEDGSYLRLKNLTLGYTLPTDLSRKAYLSNARLYLSAQNLFTLTRYSGFDPEVGAGGVDLGTYPVTRTVSLGLNIQF